MSQYGIYPSTFYRVSLKAVIRNADGHVLCVTESERDMWELPGGGLEHGESIQQGLARELHEEINYTGNFSFEFIDSTILYEDMSERCVLYMAYAVTLDEPNTISAGKDIMQIEFKDPNVFKEAHYRGGQMIYKHSIDHTFPIKFDRNA